MKAALGLALGLAALACGSPSYTVVDATTGQPGAFAEPDPVGPADLVDALAQARLLWAEAGVAEQAYVPWVRYAPDDGIDALCAYPEGTRLMGCWAGWDAGGIYMAERVAGRPVLLEVMAHEFGHALRGRGGHLAGCRDALMCERGYGEAEPTATDVAFVLGAL